MKILLNFNYKKKNLNSLGGIETLNYNFYKRFNKKLKNIKIETIPISKNYDVIISSNDARIFDKFKSKKNILWLHNKLQIEKSIRKKQFLSIIRNKINAVFVSRYLEKSTSRIYNFETRSVIKNFLDINFENIKINYKRKPIILWSVQREKGLKETIKIWIERIFNFNTEAEFHIFGVKKIKEFNYLKKYNIFFHGRVNKKTLISYYTKSTAMICLGYDETFCLNAIESFSCGTPVISFKKTALNDLIKNNKNGFKVDNFDQLSKRINYLINLNKKSKKKIIDSTYKYSKNFYFNKFTNQWLNLISK